MSRDFKELLNSETESDLTIRVQGQDIRAHRAVLAARSPVFSAMLKSDMKEAATGIINFNEYSVASFRDFLTFIYAGQVELTLKNSFDLYKMADMFDQKRLKALSLQFLHDNVTTESLWDVVKLALKHNEAALLKQATEFFALHLQEIIVTVQWQAFLSENPTEGNELLIKALAGFPRFI